MNSVVIQGMKHNEIRGEALMLLCDLQDTMAANPARRCSYQIQANFKVFSFDVLSSVKLARLLSAIFAEGVPMAA